jgi:type VI secretion system protein ImpB
MAVQDELPRSRITLTYRTTIHGKPEEVNLPFRVLMLGDFSLGSSDDRKVDLEERKLRAVTGGNLSELMKDMKMSLRLQVPNRVNPEVESDLDMELPIEGMKSFHPDEIVKHVPKLKALLLLRTLLLEMQSSIDNRKELRRVLYELFSKPEQLKQLLADLKDYESLRLPEGGQEAPPPAPPAAPASSAQPS